LVTGEDGRMRFFLLGLLSFLIIGCSTQQPVNEQDQIFTNIELVDPDPERMWIVGIDEDHQPSTAEEFFTDYDFFQLERVLSYGVELRTYRWFNPHSNVYFYVSVGPFYERKTNPLFLQTCRNFNFMVEKKSGKPAIYIGKQQYVACRSFAKRKWIVL
jgi:hypothetical protein